MLGELETLQPLRDPLKTVGLRDRRVASIVTSPLSTEREGQPSRCSAPVLRQLWDDTKSGTLLEDQIVRDNLRDDPASERPRF